jgi:hypothetical protein
MVGGTKSGVAMILVGCMSPFPIQACAQDRGVHNEVGIVYYQEGSAFKPIDKESAPQSGRSNYSAKVSGAHATLRLRADQPQIFQVCGVDPTRYKLFRFRSEGNARKLTIAKVNMWIGGSKTVLSESELPIAIRPSENGCFTLTPKQTLENGEFGFSPTESMDAFMFGVGDPK